MKIRRLEIQGFKSFADRTVLKFGDGITGVVGPNGCGKSNIVDAIRWVMGEQSAKHLRGAGMQDVIFAGSETRGPSGMAEVSISFKNDGHHVPPEYRKFDELSVTRRLFRDGTSEYAINKVPSRLRDILDLFMGTGIGKNAYSIIEQGRIGLIVTAKPDDRRALIEDAAGVSRYKARRKQAERRIDATEQNLLRVTDLCSSLGERLTTLDQQADKAREYTRIKDELRALELHAGALRWLELEALDRHAQGHAQRLRSAVESREADIEAEEARIDARERDLEERRGALRTKEHEYLAAQQTAALAENNAAAYERERAQLEERRHEAEAELTDLRAEREAMRAEAFEAERNAETMASDAEEAAQLDAQSAELAQAQGDLERERSALETAKQHSFEVGASIRDAETKAAANAQQRSDIAARLEKLGQARHASGQRAREATQQAKEAEKKLNDRRQLKLSLEAQRSEQEAIARRMHGELAELDERLGTLRNDLSDRRARLQSLEEIQRNYEGSSDAVRTLMQRREDAPAQGAHLHGLVADVVSAEPRLETAVEAVLGERLQYVIVNDQESGVASIQYLQAVGEGRSTFVPLDLREDHVSWAPRRRWFRSSHPPLDDGSEPPEPSRLPSSTEHPAPIESDVGPAVPAPSDALPPVGAGFHAAIEDSPETSSSELRSVLPAPGPVESVEANQIAGVADGPYRPGATVPPPLPTVEDDLPVPDSADSFVWVEAEDDHWPDLSHPGVVGKMVDLVRTQPGYEHVARVLLGDVVVVRDLDEARRIWSTNGHRKTLVTLEGEVLDPVGLLTGGASEHRTSGILARKRLIKELQEEVRSLATQVELTEEQREQRKRKVTSLQAELDGLSAARHEGELSIVNLEQDLARLQAEIARESEEQKSLLEDIESLEARRAKLVAEAEAAAAPEALEANRAAAEAEVDALAQRVDELTIEVRSRQETVTELRVSVVANRERREAAQQNLDRIRKRLTDIDAREERLLQTTEQNQQAIDGLSERIESQRTEARRLAEWLDREQAHLTTQQAALSEEERAVREEGASTRAKRAEIDRLKEQAGEWAMKIREFELGRSNLLEQIEERYHVDIRTLLSDYHHRAPASREDAKTIKRHRKKLEQMGPINLTAIEESQEVRERFEYLEGQRQDLEDAVASLRNAIRRINKTSRERYVEAFRLVNEKFQQVFPRLFSGGRCALVMTDEADPLESGIEIMAQPPGKKLQSVSLLSGGEKALTAVALIFGIFLIKPTPFCLLDEVDAPLDEANVGRYNDMLREMSAISQFILITHNKRTMELPDRLYGVTMEDPGVSKLVPVDVSEGSPMVSNG
jgi:chromosome segregation protein